LELLVIAGFLGSGKTTLILSLAQRLTVKEGKRLVIIENEAGEVGIDGQYLQKAGLMVQELYTGCVCCQLVGDLMNTLERVEQNFQPEIVVVEPSGVAQLGSLMNALQAYAHNIDRIRVLSLIDILRFDALIKVVSPLITSHVEKADIVALNKVEDIPPQRVDQVVSRLKEIKSDAHILPISATEGINMDSLLDRFLNHI
jgi:G3E family GTPase